MREILFRGKICETCKYQEQWLIGYYAVDNGKPIIAIPENNGLNGFVCYSKSVGQYTGLTDKNGKRIFEGDIIGHHYKNLAKNGYTSDKGVVKWDCKECFFYRTSLSGKDKTISGDCIYEVIGNVFDNPELLEGDKT